MKQLTLFLLLSFFATLGFGQTRQLSGIVQDEKGYPLIGATVTHLSTSTQAITDINGEFTLAVTDTVANLEIKLVGFQTQRISAAPNKEKIIITLKEEIGALEEVVVIGYDGKRRAKTSTMPATKSMSTRGIVPDMATAPMASRSDSYAPRFSSTNGIAAGQLTAGEIHDFSKWELWQDIAKEDLQTWQKHWKLRPLQRYTVQLVTETSDAISNAVVQLKSKNGKIVWQSKTDNTGKAELWANLFSTEQQQENYTLEVQHNGKKQTVKSASDFHNGINIIKLAADCTPSNAVDVVWVVDATGSMSDEIAYLQAELSDVIDKVKDTLPILDINMGSVFYRDEGDEYVVRKSPLSKSIKQTIEFIQQQQADGGGDSPEAVEQALDAAINGLDWREDARARLLFLVLDAPPHHTPEILQQLQDLAAAAAAKGIRIIPVAGSGIDKSTEYLMRAFALATNGTYVFLTDHSGIGNPHLEPTTDTYEVEKFNDLLVRLFYQYTFIPYCQQDIALMIQQDTLSTVTPSTQTDAATATLSALNWKYYPNPTSGIVTIELEGESDEIFIADLSGKIIKRFVVNKQKQVQINIGEFPTGMYFIKIPQDNDKWLSGQVVLTRA